jgi:hypothetical protein
MAATDRAFRALGRAEPDTLLVRALAPDLLPPHLAASSRLASADARLDTPDPSLEVDLALHQIAGPILWHLEGQGYKDLAFPDRVLRYHLGLVLRHWEREVRTVAIWLVIPSPEEALELMRKGAVSVLVKHLVLPRVRVSQLLLDPQTACFALAGDDEGRGDGVVAQQTVAVLQTHKASLRQWQMAAVAARSRSHERYRAMVKAMDSAGVPSVIIEDLIHIGEEYGFDRGRLVAGGGEASAVASGPRGDRGAAGEGRRLRGPRDPGALARPGHHRRLRRRGSRLIRQPRGPALPRQGRWTGRPAKLRQMDRAQRKPTP